MKNMTNEEYKEYNKVMYKAIKFFIKKYNFKEIDELESCATEALVYSLKKYNEEKGSKFTTYLYNNCIYYFFNNIVKNQKSKLNEYIDYKNKKISVNKEDILNYFQKENEDLDSKLTNEKVYKLILEILKDDKFKLFSNEKKFIKEYFVAEKNEDVINFDKFLAKKIAKELKDRYNIDKNDISF